MIDIYYKAVKEKELVKINEFKKGSWINVENPTSEELDFLVETFGIERDLCLDALDQFEVPRIEKENGKTYFFTRVPEKEGDEVITIPLLIVIGEDFTLSLSSRKLDFLENFIINYRNIHTTQKIKLFLQLLFSINSRYGFFLSDINRRIRKIKFKLKKLESQDIIQFIDYEKILNDFLSALVPSSAAMTTLVDGRSLQLFEKDHDLLEDVLLGSNQHIEVSKSTLKYIINIRDAYSTIMTNELNKVIKFLTSLTILLTVPTMIASFLGMNVKIPFANNNSALVAIVAITGMISLTLLMFFKKKDWI